MRTLTRLLAPLVSPSQFDFWAQRLDRTASWNRPLARVLARRLEAADTVTLSLHANRHFAGYRPGQHVNLTAEVEGRGVTRSYSPSSAPRADGRFDITVRAVAGGRLSQHLVRHARVGDVVEVGPAFGELAWRGSPAAPHLFLAAGSGITPLMSLLRAADDAGQPLDLDLVYWASRRADLCFADELQRRAAGSGGRLRVHRVLTREAELQAFEHGGRASAALLQRLVPDHARRAVLACGPQGFVQTVRSLLPAHDLRAESFTPAAPLAAASGSVRVELARTGRILEVASDRPLLEALEAQGLQPQYGCRMGICNTCACAKLGGSTQDLDAGTLDAEPNAALRLCVNRAASDLILDL